jgi:hypothetical protein
MIEVTLGFIARELDRHARPAGRVDTLAAESRDRAPMLAT